MNFDETNKVIIQSMNKIEAKVFILFLKSEIARHQIDIYNAEDLIYDVSIKFNLEEINDDINSIS